MTQSLPVSLGTCEANTDHTYDFDSGCWLFLHQMPRYIADAGCRVRSIPRPTITYNSACIPIKFTSCPAHPIAFYQLVDAFSDNDIDTPAPAKLDNLPGGGATTTTHSLGHAMPGRTFHGMQGGTTEAASRYRGGGTVPPAGNHIGTGKDSTPGDNGHASDRNSTRRDGLSAGFALVGT